ncbi:ribbon-helix-helix protein, CopG family [Clostridium ihumii]|uniref:ribbon-helix-helix protein, CopG family n=1 Tax=Clostridium ihumii TaxID=1470356 RepID=UPI0006840E18|nr:ribbon-helix-helix protein, CopG family [Clostridium ihumii]
MDTTFSVRISDELKDKFNNLAIKEGINNKEFMETMIKFYELNSIKDDSLNISEDINELQALTNRMVDIFINSVERTKVKELELNNLNKEFNSKKETEIEELKEEVNKLKEENKKIKELNKEIEKRDEKIKSLNRDLDQLKGFNEMLEEKNKEMEKAVFEVNSIKENEVKMKEFISNLEKDIMNLNSNIKEKDILLESTKDKLNALEDKYEKDIENLKSQNTSISQMEKEKLNLDFQRELLNLEQEYKEKLTLRENELNGKIMTLMEKREEDGEVIRKLIMGKQKEEA